MQIAKYAKPGPYFMKYAGDYYKRIKKFLKSKSNMNRLCWDIEKWHSNISWGKRDKNFDYRIMLDDSVEVDEVMIQAIEQIFFEYNRECTQLKKDEYSIRREYGDFEINWNVFYDKYRAMCREVCPCGTMLANAVVILCYEKHPKKTKGFMWNMAGDEIISNIKPTETLFPIHDETNGEYEYLGKMYRLQKVEDVQFTDGSGVVSNELAEWEED